MKKLGFLFITLFILSISNAKDFSDTEKEEIIKVNEEEKNAFFDNDLERLASIWVQKPSSKRYSYANNLKILDGWSEIYSDYKNTIGGPGNWNATFSNYNVNIYDNTALVYHDINWSRKDQEEQTNVITKRVVHLVKEDGKWKISFIAMLTEPNQE